MFKNKFLLSQIMLLGSLVIFVPTTQAETALERPESLLPLKSAPLSAAELASNPAGSLPAVDLDNLETPDGQKLENPEAIKAKTTTFMTSLTKQQKSRIKAVLDANKSNFDAQLMQLKDATKAKGDIPDPQSLKDQSEKVDAAISKINSDIKAVLTKKQAAMFDATLPKKLSLPQGATAQLSPGDCYDAFYFYYYYNYEYYAYYAYYYAYYNYYYGSSDPASATAFQAALDTYIYSYYAGLYAFYAYYYSNSTDAFYAWYFADHVTPLAEAAYKLAGKAYYWTGGSYAYAAYYYSIYAWYTSYYNGYGGENYAYRCYYY